MKKNFFGLVIFVLTACQPSTPALPDSLFPTATFRSTIAPVTSTLQPTQTFEPSPTALPRFFTNEFNNSPAGWVILLAGNESVPNVKTENGSLVLEMDSPFTWLYALYAPEDYADVRIDVLFQNRAGTSASAGLVCRYNEADGWFEFNVSADGSYNLLYGKWLSPGISDYRPIADGSSKLIQPSGARQRIGLICSESTLTLFVDATVLRKVDVSRYKLGEGKVGIAAASYENIPVVAGFDWVKVSAP